MPRKIRIVKIAFALLLLPLAAMAQPGSYGGDNSPVGSVGEETMDSVFFQDMQFVHPEFSFSPDSAEFVSKLKKAYIYNRALADLARENGMAQNSDVQAHLKRIRHLAEDAFLAQLYEKQLSSRMPEVSEKEVREYYTANLDRFTEPGVYSYIWASLQDTSQENIESVREKIAKYMSLGESFDEFKMGSPETYLMSYEKDHRLRSDDELYDIMRAAKQKEIIGPVKLKDRTMIYVIIDKIPEQTRPYKDVREECLQNLIMEKQSQQIESIRREAMEKYPVKLNRNYFIY